VASFEFLSEDDVDRMLMAAEMRHGSEGLRLSALLELFYATGLTVSELIGLPLYALSRDGRMLTVRGKGGKKIMVPLSEPALDAIKAYKDVRESFLPKGRRATGDRWLFPSGAKQGFLTRARFGQMMKELAVEAGLDPKRVSPRVLRYSFASHFIAHGANLRSVQLMFGFSDSALSLINQNALGKSPLQVLRDSHPLAKMNILGDLC
jgi:integrase/recombinase XerD